LNRANWKDSAELIGVLAIVLLLIFVGLQIKRPHEIAIAAQYQARLGTQPDSLTASVQSEVLLRIAGERVRSSPLPEGIDQVEWKEWQDNMPVVQTKEPLTSGWLRFNA
jgi:hypothetical protein